MMDLLVAILLIILTYRINKIEKRLKELEENFNEIEVCHESSEVKSI